MGGTSQPNIKSHTPAESRVISVDWQLGHEVWGDGIVPAEMSHISWQLGHSESPPTESPGASKTALQYSHVWVGMECPLYCGAGCVSRIMGAKPSDWKRH